MSILQYPDAINTPDLQVWNNAAFDNGDTEALAKASWCPFQPMFVNRSETLDSDSSKENQSPSFCKSPVSVKSAAPIKPHHLNGATENLKGKPLKLLFKQGLLCPSQTISENRNEIVRDDRKIDSEIEEVEMEISRLSSKLEALRLEKEKKNLNQIERSRDIAHAKLMDPKQSSKNLIALKEIPLATASTKHRRRGVSLGPSEIVEGVRSRPTEKPESTSIQSTQSRRTSSFFSKLPEINEDKVTTQRGGRCLSLSPKSRQPVSKIQTSKQGFTTVGSKKSFKKDNGVLSSIQPKKLFKEGGEKSIPIKKPVKSGRVIASRYNQIPAQVSGNQKSMDHRKRSLPENEEDESKRIDKKRSLSVGKSHGFLQECSLNCVTGSRRKKWWEIPSEAVNHKNLEDDSLLSISKITDLLPRISTVRCTNESPRDSGPAKRVTELIRRKMYFGDQVSDAENSACQALSFEEYE